MNESNHECKELEFIANLWLNSIKKQYETSSLTLKPNEKCGVNHCQQLSQKGAADHCAKPEPSPMFNKNICYEAALWLCNSLTRTRQHNEYKRYVEFAQAEIEIYEELLLKTWKDKIRVIQIKKKVF